MVIQIFILLLSIYLMLITIVESLTQNVVKKKQIILNFINIIIGILFLIFYHVEFGEGKLTNTGIFEAYAIVVAAVFLISIYRKIRRSMMQQKYYQITLNTIKTTSWNIYYVIGKNDKIVDISESFLQELGRTRSDVLNKNIFQVFNEQIRFVLYNGEEINNNKLQLKYAKYADEIKENQSIVYEAVFMNFENKEVAVKFTETPIFISGDYKGRLVIGEKKNESFMLATERELLEVREERETLRNKYIAILELIKDGIYFRSDADDYIWLSDETKEMLQVDKNNLKIMEFEVLIHPEDYFAYKSKIASLLPEAPLYTQSYRIKVKYDYVWVKETGKLVKDGNNYQVISCIKDFNKESIGTSTVKDVTELQEKLELYLGESLPFSLVYINLRNVLEINRSHGYTVGNVIIDDYVQNLCNEYINQETSIYKIHGIDYAILTTDTSIMETFKNAVEEDNPIFTKNVKVGALEEFVRPCAALINNSANITDAIDLLEKVNKTLQYAKSKGAEVYCYYEHLKGELYDE